MNAIQSLFPKGSVSLTQLMKYCDKIRLPKDKIICVEGEVHTTMYVLQLGRVSFYDGGESAVTRHRISTMTTGAFINEEGLFFHKPSAATVITNEESTLIGITKEHWDNMLREDPKMAIQVIKAIFKFTSNQRNRLAQEMRSMSIGFENDDEDIDDMLTKLIQERQDQLGTFTHDLSSALHLDGLSQLNPLSNQMTSVTSAVGGGISGGINVAKSAVGKLSPKDGTRSDIESGDDDTKY